MDRETEHRLIAAELNYLAASAEGQAEAYSLGEGKNVRQYLKDQAGRLREAARANIQRAEEYRQKIGAYSHLAQRVED